MRVVCRINELMAQWRTAHPTEPKLTQKLLAEKTGLTEATVSALCRNQGARIEYKTITALCDFFDCEIGDLLTLQE